MSKWVWPTVCAAFIVFVCFGLLAQMMLHQGRHSGHGATDPEWQALDEAQSKGPAGIDELHHLMVSAKDESVANLAAQSLASEGAKGVGLFLEGFYDADPARQSQMAWNYGFDSSFWPQVAEVISSGKGKQRDGAELLVRVAGTGYASGHQSLPNGEQEIAEALIDAVPRAEGDFADNLAYTISLFNPQSTDKLVEYLRSDDAKVRKIAVQALGKIGSDDVLADVQALKTDKDKGVRTAALIAEASISAKLAAVADLNTSIRESENAKKRLGMP